MVPSLLVHGSYVMCYVLNLRHTSLLIMWSDKHTKAVIHSETKSSCSWSYLQYLIRLMHQLQIRKT